MPQSSHCIFETDWTVERSAHGADVEFMVEFFLRMAAWERVLRTGARSPFFDISEAVDFPFYRTIPEKMARLPGFTSLSLPAQRVCLWHLNWENLPIEKIASLAKLPSPYEPLIQLLCTGGRFRIEDRFVDVGDVGIPWIDWRKLAT